PRIDIWSPPAFGRLELRRLQQHRQVCKSWIVEQLAERFDAQTSPSDVLVAIDAAPAGLLRVIQGKHAKPIETDKAIEIAKRGRIAVVCAQVVSGGEQVTRIEAHADS